MPFAAKPGTIRTFPAEFPGPYWFDGSLMRILFRLLSALPLSVLHALGALIGWLAYFSSPTLRRMMATNLALATPALGAGSVARIRRASIAHMGMGMLELPWVWLRPRTKTQGAVREVIGTDLVLAARERGRGILFLTPHIGCFEIIAQYLAEQAPITVLYSPPKQAWLQTFIDRGRGGKYLHPAPADLSGVRQLLRALKKNEAVGILPDQVPSEGEGLWMPYFGRPAYTMTFAPRLTETNATVIFTYAQRLPGVGYRIVFEEPAVPFEGDLATRTHTMNRNVEAVIAHCPEQYLWSYNRYKRPSGAPLPPNNTDNSDVTGTSC